MKKLSLPLLISLITFSACAQSSHLDKFYEQYHAANDGDGIDPSFLFNLSFAFNHSDSQNDKDGNWTRKITSVRCLIIDSKKTPNASGEWSDLSSSLRADRFEEWFSARKGQGRVQFLSRDKGDVMEDVACLIVGDDGSGLFFHLRGHFTAADRARMEAALQSHEQ